MLLLSLCVSVYRVLCTKVARVVPRQRCHGYERARMAFSKVNRQLLCNTIQSFFLAIVSPASSHTQESVWGAFKRRFNGSEQKPGGRL